MRRRSLPEIAIKHPITVMMLSIALVALGIISWTRMPTKFLPDMDFPFIGCFIPYPGATPEQVEREVAIPAEGVFRTIPHLKRIYTTSDSDGCYVNMLFDWNTDMNISSGEVRDRMERLKLDLPAEIERLFLNKHNSDSLPVMGFGLFRAGDQEAFNHIVTTELKPRLKRLDGVADVRIHTSVPGREVLIEFDQDQLKARNASIYEIIASLQTSNLNMALGELTEGPVKYYARVLNELRRPEDIAELVVGPNSMRLKDVARVGFRTRESESHYEVNGKGGAFVFVLKEAQANTVSTCSLLRKEVEGLKNDPMFAGTESFVFFDQGDMITSALDGLVEAGKSGSLLSITILFLFLLRIRPTLIVALAIPLSLVAGVAFMYFWGMTINIVTITSLIVGIGMLVDNSIVVLENIDRHINMGEPPMEAARKGASEVGLAITASTMTSIVVFVPVLYMQMGEMSIYMKQFAFPMTAALLASLLIALTFIPLFLSRMKARKDMMGYRFAHGIARRFRFEAKLGLVHPIEWLISGYAFLLRTVMTHRLLTILVITGVACATYYIPFQRVATQAMPALDVREVDITLDLEQNFDMARAKDVADTLTTAIEKERDTLDIKNVFVNYSAENGMIRVYLREIEDYPSGEIPPYTTEQATHILRKKLPELVPGVEVRITKAEGGGPGGRASRGVAVWLRGDDSTILRECAERFKMVMSTVPGLLDVRVDTEREKDEIRLKIDEPLANKAGVSPFVVARTVDLALRGTRLPYLKQGGREYSVWAQFREEDRKTRANLDNVGLLSPLTGLVPLNQLVEYQKARSPSAIRRQDGKIVTSVSAKTMSDDTARIQRDIQQIIEKFPLPQGYTVGLGDELEEMATNAANFVMTLGMAVLLVYIVMAALFGSYLLPMSILTTVPLAFLGVYWAMFITKTPMDTIALIGCILMVGVIVNNGIVIVDHINQLRLQGYGRLEAILKGGRDRFRPVMMTALTTILGCIPLAMGGSSPGGVSFVGLGRAFIGGLTSGTVLTLVVVPLMYTFVDDFHLWLRGYIADVASLGKMGPAKTTENAAAPPPLPTMNEEA